MDYGKSRVPESEHFETIMEQYRLVGRAMTAKDFWQQYICKIDKSISYKQWTRFLAKFNKDLKERSNKIIEKVANKLIKDEGVEQMALRKMLIIGDYTLDEIIRNPEKLAAIPVEKRISMFFGAMKARDTRMNTLIKKKSEDRKTDMYEELMKGAQYGAIDASEVSETNIHREKALPAAIEPDTGEYSSKSEQQEERVTFDPSELEKHAED